MIFKKHPFSAVINEESKFLILGTMPSLTSVEQGFYYMHPQNRFWKVLSRIYQEDSYSMSIEEKKKFILRHHLALFDVIESCFIEQSSDQSIQQVKVHNLKDWIEKYSIERVLLNGKKAYSLFIRQYPQYREIAICLPSTSSANAAISLDKLVDIWEKALRKE